MPSDNYPGDAAYTQIVQTVYRGVASDSISMASHEGGATKNRPQIAQLLVDRHNNQTNPGQAQSNAAYLGTSLTEQEVVNALTYTQGYVTGQWNSWAGNHVGNWYDTSRQFTDNARWLPSALEPTNNPQSDLDGNGQPRAYDFQKAEFLEAGQVVRTGWNQSHPDVLYLWGWDPKNQGNAQGRIGTHVGLPFTKDGVSVIVWFTPQEAFLECVGVVSGVKRRTSTGLEGFGQWIVS